MNRTLAIHGSADLPTAWGEAVPAIYQTITYAHGTAQELADVFDGRRPGYLYTRTANPSNTALELRLADLEQAVGVVATASGMGAISTVLLGLLGSGDEVVAAEGIFGGTISLLEDTLGRLGVVTRWVDASETEQVAAVLNERTRLIFVESIGNPKMDVPDLAALADLAHQRNIPLVVDNTVPTPVLLRGRDVGADLVVYSTSKAICGHATALGGAIVDTGRYDWSAGPFEHLRPWAERFGEWAFLRYLRSSTYRDVGAAPAPMNSFLTLQGLQTLPLRMAAHCDNALALAGLLQQHAAVSWVHYPGLPDSPYHERVRRQFGGRAGGLLTFGLADRDAAFRFIDALKRVKNLANIGQLQTVVVHPASTIFNAFSPQRRRELSVTDDLIRVSVGLEDIQDVWADFEQALAQAAR